MTFHELDLDPKILQAIDDLGFTRCTPVQEQTFVYSLIGADVAVQSQTGTGKTAAFLVSIFQLFLEQRSLDDSIALIVAPTRELADQIEDDARQLGKYLDFPIASFYGGVGYANQERALADGVRVAIGTPGRLLDFADQHKLDLSKVGILVIDEADRLFDMGFIPDLRRLIRRMPGRDARVTMLYSATLSTRVKTLAFDYMRSPAEITITPERVTVEEISQQLYHVARERKFSLLLGVLARDQPENALIFTNTKQAAYEVATRMQRNGLECEYIIGDLPQSKRQRLIDQLKAGELRYLVATDVAARGLHVEGLDLVVNYELPEYSENYVHRIGRTARAGRSGKAIALACEEYVFALPGIEEFIRAPIPVAKTTDDLYVEDVTGGARLGHYLGVRSRDDRRTNAGRGARRRTAGRGTAGRERRPELVGAGADRARGSRTGRTEAGAVAARERTPGARSSGGSPDHNGAGANRSAGGQESRGTSAGRRRSRSRSRSRGAVTVAAGATTAGRPVSAANGAAVAGNTRGAGGDSEARRRDDRDRSLPRQGNGSGRRPRTAEERLARYREKYGEEFKLAEQPVTMAESRTDPAPAGADRHAPAGLRGLFSRLLGKRSRTTRKSGG